MTNYQVGTSIILSGNNYAIKHSEPRQRVAAFTAKRSWCIRCTINTPIKKSVRVTKSNKFVKLLLQMHKSPRSA